MHRLLREPRKGKKAGKESTFFIKSAERFAKTLREPGEISGLDS
jgi:hypothetical protein